MNRRDDIPVIVDHDVTTRTTVVVCQLCGYRELVRTRAAGWTHAAIHLKGVHDELHAAHVARDCARKCRDAADSPDHRRHGYTADDRHVPSRSRSRSGRGRAAGRSV